MSYEAGNQKLPLPRWRVLERLRSGVTGRPLRPPRSSAWRLLNSVGPCLGLLMVIGLFSLSPTVRPYFLTGANFKIILTQTVIVAIGSLGMTLVIVSAGIDLSVGSVVALASVVGAISLLHGHSVFVSTCFTLAVGALVGLI